MEAEQDDSLAYAIELSLSDLAENLRRSRAQTGRPPWTERRRSMAEPSSNAAPSSSSRLPEKEEEVTCSICAVPIEGEIITIQCNHSYDVTCLLEFFRRSMAGEAPFPPTCCERPFELIEVVRFLPQDLIGPYATRLAESRIVRRLYCHGQSCSAFLGAVTAHPTVVPCRKCALQTCGRCKQKAHSPNERCEEADPDAEVLALANEKGWKQCPRCGHMVELSAGCNHMTCRCKHQFCYVCTKKWKTCRCPQFEQRRARVDQHDEDILEEALQRLSDNAILAPDIQQEILAAVAAVRGRGIRRAATPFNHTPRPPSPDPDDASTHRQSTHQPELRPSGSQTTVTHPYYVLASSFRIP